MLRKAIPLLGASFLAGVFLGACAIRSSINQVEFGVWAAEKELWEEAIFRWEKALAENPNAAAAHNNLAVAYEKKGLWEEARKAYEIALKLEPKNSWIKANYKAFLTNLESMGQEEKAAKETERKKDEKPL